MGEKLEWWEVDKVIGELARYRQGEEGPLDTLKRLSEPPRPLPDVLAKIRAVALQIKGDITDLWLHPPISFPYYAEERVNAIRALCDLPIASDSAEVGTLAHDWSEAVIRGNKLEAALKAANETIRDLRRQFDEAKAALDDDLSDLLVHTESAELNEIMNSYIRKLGRKAFLAEIARIEALPDDFDDMPGTPPEGRAFPSQPWDHPASDGDSGTPPEGHMCKGKVWRPYPEVMCSLCTPVIEENAMKLPPAEPKLGSPGWKVDDLYEDEPPAEPKPTCDYPVGPDTVTEGPHDCGKPGFLEVNGHWRCKEHTTCDFPLKAGPTVLLMACDRCGDLAVCVETEILLFGTNTHPRCDKHRTKVEEIKPALDGAAKHGRACGGSS